MADQIQLDINEILNEVQRLDKRVFELALANVTNRKKDSLMAAKDARIAELEARLPEVMDADGDTPEE